MVPDARGAAAYKLTSTVMLQLYTKVGAQLSGSLTRQAAERLPVDAGHMVNIGSMIEDMEGRLRTSLDQVQLRCPSSERTFRSTHPSLGGQANSLACAVALRHHTGVLPEDARGAKRGAVTGGRHATGRLQAGHQHAGSRH